jgi:hypothetical protein
MILLASSLPNRCVAALKLAMCCDSPAALTGAAAGLVGVDFTLAGPGFFLAGVEAGGRVLNLECLRPVPVGTIIGIERAGLHRTQAYLVTGLSGAPLEAGQGPWLEALLGFAQVDDTGRPDALPEGAGVGELPNSDSWRRLAERLPKLLHLR